MASMELSACTPQGYATAQDRRSLKMQTAGFRANFSRSRSSKIVEFDRDDYSGNGGCSPHLDLSVAHEVGRFS